MPDASTREFLRARPWTASYDPGVPADLELPETSLVHMLERSVARHGPRPALEFFGARTSYARLGEQVERAAEGLRRLGVAAGDRVAIVLPNCPQHIVAFYAVLRLGAVVVEHNPLYTAPELRHQFEDHGARVAIVWDRAADRIRSLPEDLRLDAVVAVDVTEAMPRRTRAALRLPLPATRAARAQLTGPAPGTIPWRRLVAAEPLAADHPRPTAHDLALLQYTSGTTGLPKGAMLTHRNLESNALMGQHWLHSGEDEVVHGVLPLFHAFGLTLGVTFAMSLGARLVLFPTVRADLVLKALRRSRPTVLPAVPPVYEKLLDAAEERGADLRGIAVAVSGAMTLPVPLVERWERATGGMLVEGYGLTECSPLVACNPLNDSRRAGSIGVPFPSTEIRLVDPETLEDVPRGRDGELWVRGPQVFRGYWKRPEETARVLVEDGWLRTGDVVTVDDDGFLRVVDRIKEVIITGGFNVAPTEVETALKLHDDVADAAVVGLDDGRGGEAVVAAVVLAPGAVLDEQALREHCYGKVTRYKVPRRIVAVEDLPRTMLGKTLRREVRARLEALGVQV
ncbi:long-chain fatty acid--CoA ligase [Kocuria flava]|uniref:Long-chain fatty acid--CoA ligase n=1 Tax=Kocuria flava TaxID=446860 RepID=A0A2N4T1L7_9MICC|nr:long-chain-fatty-acid--CoA ligase [Kocuria flava]PLC12066.1 long-chain fatty acid--CoA ligase [Kocuria flava]